MSQHQGTTRRQFMKTTAAAAPLAFGGLACGDAKPEGPLNVLFISIDDLNDWNSCLGGHPDAKTPNLERLAQRGVLFTNAHCAAPLCNPSRAALMTGLRPSTTGVYTNRQPFRTSPVADDAVTLSQHFMQNGYTAKGSGKIYHGLYPDPPSWEEYWPSQVQNKPPDPLPEGRPLNGIKNTRHFDWGPVDVDVNEMGDKKVAAWVKDQLNSTHEKPFFLACGFYRPHLPWFVPPEYFDRFPLEEITLPEVRGDDLYDVPEIARNIARTRTDHANVTSHGEWRKAVQGYLASIAYADDCLGDVIDALDNSAYSYNTAICLWSDHGWHLGEKLHWRKFSLWEESTRNMLFFSVPGLTKSGGRCDEPVNLLDIYPTLIDACDLSAREGLEGLSLMPQLKNPNTQRDIPTLTTFNFGNHSIRSKKWRYTRYHNGAEELYDHYSDPHEWFNLSADPQYKEVKEELANYLPEHNEPGIPQESREETRARIESLGYITP